MKRPIPTISPSIPATLAGTSLSSSNCDMKYHSGWIPGGIGLGNVRHFAELPRKERREHGEKVQTEEPDHEVFEEKIGKEGHGLGGGLVLLGGWNGVAVLLNEPEVQAEQWHEERGKHRDVQREEPLQRDRADVGLARCIERRAGHHRRHATAWSSGDRFEGDLRAGESELNPKGRR